MHAGRGHGTLHDGHGSKFYVRFTTIKKIRQLKKIENLRGNLMVSGQISFRSRPRASQSRGGFADSRLQLEPPGPCGAPRVPLRSRVSVGWSAQHQSEKARDVPSAGCRPRRAPSPRRSAVETEIGVHATWSSNTPQSSRAREEKAPPGHPVAVPHRPTASPARHTCFPVPGGRPRPRVKTQPGSSRPIGFPNKSSFKQDLTPRCGC